MKEFEPLRRWFGDWGGGFCADDITNYDQEQYAKGLARRVKSQQFRDLQEEIFHDVLGCSWDEVRQFELESGKHLYVTKNLSWHCNLAGQLAMARLEGRERLCGGTRERWQCLCAARAAQKLGMELTLVLSREQAQDDDFVAQLEALGCIADRKTCVDLPDSPYAYAMYRCESSPVYVLVLEANFGPYPCPALAGLLAGRFGEKLLDLTRNIELDSVMVPITTGTEAVGVFNPWLNSGREGKLMTCESLISEEYHIIDMANYTLATRSAEKDQPNTTLCPELVDWWRMAKVLRLGCDRCHGVDTGAGERIGLSPASARAMALAFERGATDLLILEVPHE